MRPHPSFVLALVTLTLVGTAVALVELQTAAQPPLDDPRAAMARPDAPVSHDTFFREFSGGFATGPEVTAACLKCHAQAAHDFMTTSHWTWAGDHLTRAGLDEPVAIGKKNLINNFCISIESNWPRCTSCHAGYGWRDASFDFGDATAVDCLVCHDTSGTYHKAPTGAGLPGDGVDLLAAAKSVGRPTRANCGSCHFSGGGGDAVKHGDLDGTMAFPTASIDVHMGRHDVQCVDCHRTEVHEIPGRSMAVSVSNTQRVTCTDCHRAAPHGDERLDAHVATVACQSCHIPQMAVRAATKMQWDWSQAGEDRPGTAPHEYDKKKGAFVYEQGVTPDYRWYNGTSDRYLKGDRIDPDGVTALNHPHGDVRDPDARIWPFKIHRGRQIYDAQHLYFLVPQTYGPGGYWETFDWDRAARQGSAASGLAYSGRYDFAATEMYWPLSHMVAPEEQALQCADCHGAHGRMDWRALGYEGDPAQRGGRAQSGLLRAARVRHDGDNEGASR